MKLPLDNINNSYFTYNENGRNTRNIRNFPRQRYYLNSPKISAKSYIDTSYNDPSFMIYPKKDYLNTIYTDNDNNAVYHVIHSLKNTLQDTERIKKEYLCKSKSFRAKKPKKISDSIMDISSYNTKYDDYSINNDDVFNISSNNDIDINVDEKSENEKQNKIIKDKLNKERSILMKYNIKMRKENRILESEISNYKKQFLDHKNLYNIYINTFPKNVEFLKTKLQMSINNNTKILDLIFKSQQINQNNDNKIKNIYSKNENIFKKVENINREKAEIQILN